MGVKKRKKQTKKPSDPLVIEDVDLDEGSDCTFENLIINVENSNAKDVEMVEVEEIIEESDVEETTASKVVEEKKKKEKKTKKKKDKDKKEEGDDASKKSKKDK